MGKAYKMVDSWTITRTNFTAPQFAQGMSKDTREKLTATHQTGNGLPNVTREYLALHNRTSFSLLMDNAIRYSFEGTTVTEADIIAMTGLTQYTVRKALADKLVKSISKKEGKGRPTNYYRIPTKEQVMAMTTTGDNSMSDHLPEWALTSVSNYRKGRYYMLIARGCNYVASEFCSYSRSFLCSVIGVCKATLIKYERELKMLVIGNLQETEITPQNYSTLPAYKAGAYLAVDNIEKGIRQRVPAMRSLASKAIQAGATVRLMQYLPNSYSLQNWSVFKSMGSNHNV